MKKLAEKTEAADGARCANAESCNRRQPGCQESFGCYEPPKEGGGTALARAKENPNPSCWIRAAWKPEQVAEAYSEAVDGVLAVVRFGAMLADMFPAVETDEKGHRSGGAKAWLAKHCPDVNYRAASRMKGTAETVCAALGASPAAMARALTIQPAAMLDEPDAEELVTLRMRVTEIAGGRSERALVLWLKGPPEIPGEAPSAKDVAAAEKANEIALVEARKFGRAWGLAMKSATNRQKGVLAAALAAELKKALGKAALVWLSRLAEEAEKEVR